MVLVLKVSDTKNGKNGNGSDFGSNDDGGNLMFVCEIKCGVVRISKHYYW